MRYKSTEMMERILRYMEDRFFEDNALPSQAQIAREVGLSKAMVHYYLTDMQERGMLSFDESGRPITQKIEKSRDELLRVPILGQIACGAPLLAEENIDSYLTLSMRILGRGDFFVLRAKGDSMIEAGIHNDDLVIVRKQNTADEGQIVVALLENEATLKRYFLDRRQNKICLHPENRSMSDILLDSVVIQGVAVKVIHEVI